MMTITESDFEQAVKKQIELLNTGLVLEALDLFFHERGKMFENDNLFGATLKECRTKQEPYIKSAVEIKGKITDLNILSIHNICVFRNQSCFVTSEGKKVQIDGIHLQRWQDGKIIAEYSAKDSFNHSSQLVTAALFHHRCPNSCARILS